MLYSITHLRSEVFLIFKARGHKKYGSAGFFEPFKQSTLQISSCVKSILVEPCLDAYRFKCDFEAPYSWLVYTFMAQKDAFWHSFLNNFWRDYNTKKGSISQFSKYSFNIILNIRGNLNASLKPV